MMFFSNLSFRRALIIHRFIYLLVHSALSTSLSFCCQPPCRSLAHSLVTPPVCRYPLMLAVFCFLLSRHRRHHLFLHRSSYLSPSLLFLLIQHHLYPIIFLSRAILLEVDVEALVRLMYLV
ncbi:hypothetical protein DFH29DRAFT_572063 [Suillus ampliporus]|nr:hypothetical protein DFH29DRAFT_572063 [Suillus ampliporus]